MDVSELRAKIRDIKDFPTEGILFKDITTLLKDAKAFKCVLDELATGYIQSGVEIVVGVESRGFIFGGALAHELGAGFVPVRKLGKLPAKTIQVEYELEYGRDALAMHEDAISPRPAGPARGRPARHGGHDGGDPPARRTVRRGRGGAGLPDRAGLPQRPREAEGLPGDVPDHLRVTGGAGKAGRLA